MNAEQLAAEQKAERLATRDKVTAERFGMVVWRCSRCDAHGNRTTHDYAVSALLAHDEHAHVSELDKRRRQQLVNARGRQLAADALGRVTA